MTRTAAATCVFLVAFAPSACAPDGSSGDDPEAATPTIALPRENRRFDLPTDLAPDVTNPWFPLTPGTRWTYRGAEASGAAQELVVTATPVTYSVANGVEARVVRSTLTVGGEVVEDSVDWYAQDGDGTVWHLGQENAQLEDGYITSHTGSFEAGVDDALAGVVMPGHPAVGQEYRQEYYGGVAEDNGEVLALDGTATVPAGSYADVVQVARTDGIDPDVLEHRFYAEGVGLVLVRDVAADLVTAELVALTTVPARQARRAATVPLGATY